MTGRFLTSLVRFLASLIMLGIAAIAAAPIIHLIAIVAQATWNLV